MKKYRFFFFNIIFIAALFYTGLFEVHGETFPLEDNSGILGAQAELSLSDPLSESSDMEETCSDKDCIKQSADDPAFEEPLAGFDGDEDYAFTGKYRFRFNFGQTEARSMLPLINDYRKSGDAWVYSYDNVKLNYGVLDEYIYDYGLEEMAMLRAAENALIFGRTRPNGDSWKTALTLMGYQIESEGAGYESAQAAYNSFLETKASFSGQYNRRNLLSPVYKYIGIGHVKMNNYDYWVLEFSDVPSEAGSDPGVFDGSKELDIGIYGSYILSETYSFSKSSLKQTKGDIFALPTVKGNLRLDGTFPESFNFTVLNIDPVWGSEPSDFLSIDSENKTATALKGGKGGLTASIGDNYVKNIPVNVTAYAESISFESSAITADYPGSFILNPVILPEDTTNKALSFKSSNPSVAAVNSSGKVVLKGGGSTMITATTKDGTKLTASLELTVLEKINSLKVPKTLSLEYGKTASLSPTIKRTSASDKELVFENSNPSVAEVKNDPEDPSKALIKGTGVGKTVVKVSTKDGSGLSGECTITVNPMKVKAVSSVKLKENELCLRVQSTRQIAFELYPAACTYNTSVTYFSSDDSVATVNETGLITGVSEGTAVITVRANTFNGSAEGITKEAFCSVLVAEKDPKIARISLSRTETIMDQGTSCLLIANYYPEDAVSPDIYFTSSDTSVITLSDSSCSKGRAYVTLNALKSGEATILVQYKSEGVDSSKAASSSCAVTVPVSDAYLNGDEGDKPADFNNDTIWVAGLNKEFTYTGRAITPEVRVYHGNNELSRGSDFTVSYSNNTAAAKKDDKKPPQVVLKFFGNYSGARICPFTINESSLLILKDSGELTAEDITAPVKKTGDGYVLQLLKPVLLYKGQRLKENKDYTLSYPDLGKEGAYSEPGEYKISVNAKEGSGFTSSFSIKEILEEKISGSFIPFSSVNAILSVKKVYYDGDLTPVPVYYLSCKKEDSLYSLKEGTDFTATVNSGKAVGTAAIIFSAVPGSDFTGSRYLTYKVLETPVTKKTIEAGNVTLDGDGSFPYMKGGSRPSLCVEVDGVKLEENKDYVLSVYKNKAVTTAETPEKNLPSYTVKGIGDYTGTVSGNFKIKPGELEKLDLRIDDVAWSSTPYAYKKASVTIFDLDGKKLSRNSDFVVSSFFSESTTPSVGSVITVRVAAAEDGNYTGELIGSCRVFEKGADLKSYKIAFYDEDDNFIKNFEYTMREIEPSDIMIYKGKNILPSSDYYIVGYENNTKKGKAGILVRGCNAKGGLRTFYFNIKAKAV